MIRWDSQTCSCVMIEKKDKMEVTKENIPLIMKAVMSYGKLPKSSKNSPILLKNLLYMAKDNVVHMTIRQMADLTGLSVYATTRAVKILKKYKFIENRKPDGEVASIWDINIATLTLLVEAYLKAQSLRGRKKAAKNI